MTAAVISALLGLQWLAAAHGLHAVEGPLHGGLDSAAHGHQDDPHGAEACQHDHGPGASFDGPRHTHEHHPADCPICRLAHFTSLAADHAPATVHVASVSHALLPAPSTLHPRRTCRAHGARAPPLLVFAA